MERFALRHRVTKHFMPELRGRGYSHWTPTPADPNGGLDSAVKGSIRLFTTVKGADNCRVLWSRGVFERHYTTHSSVFDDFGGDDYVTPRDVGRKKDDLEIVVVSLLIGGEPMLLQKYMRHVLESEGSTFVGEEDTRHSDVVFTKEENDLLLQLRKGININDPVDQKVTS